MKKDYNYLNEEYLYKPNFDESQSYALGLLWADGWLSNTKRRSRNLFIEVVESDFMDFLPSLFSLGKVSTYRRERLGRSPQASAMITNKSLCEWLFNLGFKDKSTISPTKLISFIPDPFVKDFIRGWIDGDGCFYVNEKNKSYQFILAGAYNQDWSSFLSVLDSLKIKYTVKNKIQVQNGKENKGSVVRIVKREDLIKLIDFIYNEPKHFLKRKFIKGQIIKNAPYGNNPTRNINQLDLLGNVIKVWKDTGDIVRFYNLPSSSPIMRVINGKAKTALGFKWSCDTLQTQECQESFRDTHTFG